MLIKNEENILNWLTKYHSQERGFWEYQYVKPDPAPDPAPRYVQNDPINFIDPWGLAKITNGRIKPSIQGPIKSNLQKGIDAADGFARKQALKQVGIPTAKGLLGLTGGIGVTLVITELTNARPAGEGSDILPSYWDRDNNGIPDLIEPLPQKDDC